MGRIRGAGEHDDLHNWTLTGTTKPTPEELQQAEKTEQEREEAEQERREEKRDEQRRQRRGWQQLIGMHNGSMYMCKNGEIKSPYRIVEEMYHYNGGNGTAFCGRSLYCAKEISLSQSRRRRYKRCKKCEAALRRAYE